MDVAERQLALAPSDLGLHQVYLTAGLALACQQWPRGALTLATLDQLQRRAGAALRLDPGRTDLQDERLTLFRMKAAWLAVQGRNPSTELAAAQALLAASGRQPVPPVPKTLQALRQWAEAALRRPREEDKPMAAGPEWTRPATVLF
jgi:hypothetical protein